jgi:hypothetical protein
MGEEEKVDGSISNKEYAVMFIRFFLDLSNMIEQVSVIFILSNSLDFKVLFWIFFSFGYFSAVVDGLPWKIPKIIILVSLEAAQVRPNNIS